ncbi:OPT family small oligopeptide transporter [Kwoniella mangroviensis CBS 8507]|uniref:OPT family small oligopeptide transporter n=1 Tax=Kwoniella mangroviensis CBS 8507 TaxID=1296122 RepID=UPI00080CE672|nr:OPT family small oligopeptide transporter [Kwoniella mangroviensis CBS 8507]OCF62404.1 OPT family small oligopeptide transporter [Kwoniella mangroviensis CBS 8507]
MRELAVDREAISPHPTPTYEDGYDEPHDPDSEKQASSDDSNASSLSTRAAIDFHQDDIRDSIGAVDEQDISPSTVRMWTLLLVLSTVISGIDALFQLRYPTVSVASIVAVLVAWPVGTAWSIWLPNLSLPIGGGRRLSLNDTRFNRKELGCVLMFVNVCIAANLTNTLMVEQIKYFKVELGLGKMIFYNLGLYITSWGWTGLTHSILVRPANMIWPGVVGQLALVTNIDRINRRLKPNPSDNDGKTWKISPMGMFGIVFTLSFVYYWISGLVFPALAYIGAFISWSAPNNATLSQIFGVKTGLGLMPLAFDWSQISNLSNPLLTPFWAASCVFGAFAFWGWIVLPALYYTNTWQTGHFPIMTNSLYTVNGKSYDVTKVVTKNWTLDAAAYKKYSPLMLPAAFVLNSALGVASFAAVILDLAMNWRKDVWEPFRNRNADTGAVNGEQKRYREKVLPLWLYGTASVIGIIFGIIFVEVWRNETQVGAGAFFVSIIIAAVLFLPLAMVEARANITLNLNIFLEMVSGFWLPGKPIACMYFATSGFATLQHAMHQSQSMKMAHYLSVPPRTAALIVFLSGVWSSLVNCSVTWWALRHTANVCTSAAENNFVCRTAKTSFNTHIMWGLLGSKVFTKGGRYVEIYYFLFGAAAVTTIVFIMRRRFPDSKWALVSPTLIMNAGTLLPKNTGINFSSWFLVSFVFGYLIHKKKTAWWRKYNMITATALDSGVAIAVILIYFAITYTGAGAHISWWGTKVQNSGCDANGCAHLSVESLVKPTGW